MSRFGDTLGQGWKFRAVASMAGDDVVILLRERIETVGGMRGCDETMPHQLYAVCTRAED